MTRAEAKADADLARGDIGSARRRLCSLVATRGYDAVVIERIARLSLQMGDPIEAGRWYSLIDSSDDQASNLIERYRTSCGSPKQAALGLPLRPSLRRLDSIPPLVRARFAPFIIFPAIDTPHAPRERKSKVDRLLHRASGYGCFGLFLLLLICCLIGLGTVIRWLFD